MGDTATRYIGNCQICEGDFKVVPSKIERVDVNGETIEQPMDGKLVHHGYQRPGLGYIVGDCPGVHEKPYEISCGLIKVAIANVSQDIARMTQYIEKLERDEVDTIDEIDRGSRYRAPSVIKHKRSEMKAYAWDDVRRRVLSSLKYRVRDADRTLKQFEKREREWKPAFIRLIEEERAKKEVARATRAAEAEVRRKAKEDKRAAIDAKNKASEEKKALLVAEAIEKLREMAKSPEPAKRRYDALTLMGRLYKKVGWKFYEPKEWKIDLDLKALGVAHNKNGYWQYDHGI